MPMRMAISAVIGSLLARPRTPSVPKRRRDIVGNLSHCRRNREGLSGGDDVMDTHDRGTPAGRLDGKPDRCRIAPARLADAGQPADQTRAPGSEQDRAAGT